MPAEPSGSAVRSGSQGPGAPITVETLRQRYQQHPGRGGCGVGAIATLTGEPTRELIELALTGLRCLEHRGGNIEGTGDGAGLLFTTDARFFARFLAPGRHLPEGHRLSVGVVFFPLGDPTNLPHWQREIDAVLRRNGLAPLGWRRVPVDDSVLGARAHLARRDVWQVLIGEGMVPPEDLALSLFRVKAALEAQVRELYVASLSPRTLCYKGLCTGEQLPRYYPDLAHPELRAEAVVFHRRYSTNTFSNWTLAQPFRLLGHNGEINTIRANRNAVGNLEAELGLRSLLQPQGSDSADLDRMVELFTSHGVSLLETLCRLQPMAWRDLPDLPPEAVRYCQGVARALGALGAWEGPAAVVATDGRYVVGGLDRMGLRPLRYLVTRRGLVVVASEIGSIPVPFDEIVTTGQLDPGQIFAVDLPARKILMPGEILARVLEETPLNFTELSTVKLIAVPRRPDQCPEASLERVDGPTLQLHAWTAERVRAVKAMAESAKEPITSMGYDRPLAVLSPQRPPLSKYFKQIVAVVTNPPIDPIREGGAFDLTVNLGAAPIVSEDRPVYAPLPQCQLPSPVMTPDQMDQLDGISISVDGISHGMATLLDATFDDPAGGRTSAPADAVAGAKALARRIVEICRQGLGLVARREASVLILSDRAAVQAGSRRLPLPMVLVASALHSALSAEGKRRQCGIVVDSGEIQEGHDAAVLLANGVDAVHPHLLYRIGASQTQGGHAAVTALARALDDSIRRIMSKMGICSIDGYRGSRLFEAVGISPQVVDHYLPGITSRLGGLSLEDLYLDLCARRSPAPGQVRDSAEVSIYRKEVWSELQTTARGHDPASYDRFLKLIDETPPVYLRDLLRLRPAEERAQMALPIEEVATEEQIVASCLRGAAMSLGALHRVAHGAIAAAFNELGSASNCGEGGEDPRRDRGGVWEASRSRIRQVASGRFGVEARYMVNADELSIKIGQGAKPGEGGMLPAEKVTAEVARIRKTQPGVMLISPPPHHDIYSIEDLAQLIHNLRQCHPGTRVSVKIPAVTDIGTIAVGIAKAGADVIDISGFEGGTGAAAASSIEHAGLPLERALTEVHQALWLNGIRDRVRLRADGGIKTGFDVMAIMALGADEVSLGTALMIAEQCIFCHGCANGMCPAGITTQSELVARRLMTLKKGRAKDEELPDEEEERYQDARLAVLRYLRALAGDIRRRLAALGLRHPAELIGRVDLLERRSAPSVPATLKARVAEVDLAELLADPAPAYPGHRGGRPRLPADPTSPINAVIGQAVAQGSRLVTAEVHNTDHAVGATLAGQLAQGRVPATSATTGDPITLRLRGYAGQALGFACVEGLRIELEGFANDTAGEAMSGGALVIRAPREIAPEARAQLSVVGNALAYGATGGRLFVEGRAGQRVGVRNSGAVLVVEGAGKYAFEYMTGGVGVVLGTLGPVVGSGLTGGVLYLLDEGGLKGGLEKRLHADAVAGPLLPADELLLRALLEEHLAETGSHRAATLLGDWDAARHRFLRVVPRAAPARPVAAPAAEVAASVAPVEARPVNPAAA